MLPKRPAHYLWAVLMAHIYEVFPLLCPICGGQKRIIALITYSADIQHILKDFGVPAEPPHIASAQGPPLCDEAYVQVGESEQPLPDWDEGCQAPSDIDADQRFNW